MPLADTSILCLGHRNLASKDDRLSISKQFGRGYKSISGARRRLTWSYSEEETRKRMEVTESKHSNQRRLSERWPPTSTILKGTFLISKSYSWMPLVGFLARRMSCWLGR